LSSHNQEIPANLNHGLHSTQNLAKILLSIECNEMGVRVKRVLILGPRDESPDICMSTTVPPTQPSPSPTITEYTEEGENNKKSTLVYFTRFLDLNETDDNISNDTSFIEWHV